MHPWLRVNAALLALTAGAVHLGQVGIHLEEGWPVATFFVVVGVVQVGAAVLLIRPRPRWWFLFGIAGTTAVIGIWVMSRSVGLPFGVDGAVEPLGVADSFASLIETWTVVILGLYLSETLRRGRLAAYVIGAASIFGLALLWQAAALGGVFNADPARFTAAQPQLIDWLIAAIGLALGGGILLGRAAPTCAPWQRGLLRGLAAASVVASAGSVWMTLPPTIGQNVDCRYGPLAAIQVGGHTADPNRVPIGAGEARILPVFELRVCGGAQEVTLEAVEPVTVIGDGAMIDGFWLLPIGTRLSADGADTLPAGAQSIPPGVSIQTKQPRQLVVRLIATGAGLYTLGSVRLAYLDPSPESFSFATTVAICSGTCPAE